MAWYRYWHYVFLRRALSRRLSENARTVVYAQCPVAALGALRARRYPTQRVVMAVHFEVSQADEWVDKGLIRPDGALFKRIRALEARVIPALDGIVYVARSAQKSLIGRLPSVKAVPYTVIPNFVPACPTPAGGWSPRRPELVSVGGLEVAKNHGFLLEVLQEANRLGHHYRLDIIGEGPCRASLQRQIRARGLEAQVRLLGYRPDVPALLSRYRLYVHSSTREVMPLAPIEAMAARLPVVAVPVGGLPEILKPGLEGLFWSPDDAPSGANTIIRILEDEPLRTRMADAARDRFARELSADVAAPRLLAFLDGYGGPVAAETSPPEPVT